MKNVVSDSLDVKKLVYMYVIRYADVRQDEALLSINSFQRDLQDPAPYIRALALRVMSSIQVPMIAQIVLMAVRKCASDPSAYVRKTAAFAVPKAYRFRRFFPPSLLSALSLLSLRLSFAIVLFSERTSITCSNGFRKDDFFTVPFPVEILRFLLLLLVDWIRTSCLHFRIFLWIFLRIVLLWLSVQRFDHSQRYVQAILTSFTLCIENYAAQWQIPMNGDSAPFLDFCWNMLVLSSFLHPFKYVFFNNVVICCFSVCFFVFFVLEKICMRVHLFMLVQLFPPSPSYTLHLVHSILSFVFLGGDWSEKNVLQGSFFRR